MFLLNLTIIIQNIIYLYLYIFEKKTHSACSFRINLYTREWLAARFG